MGVVLLGGWLGAERVIAAEAPNILLILADDLGYGDVGFTGAPESRVRTPNLDRLAAEGMVMTDFHSNGSACTPTRAALMTGRYQQRTGLSNVLFPKHPRQEGYGLAPEEWLIPEVLAGSGYQSALFGKWHLGAVPEAQPLSVGFDKFIGNIEGHVDYISKWNRLFYDWNKGFERFEEEGYVTELLTTHAIGFMEGRVAEGKPFFIYLSHACPHTPHMLPDDPPMYGTDRPRQTVDPEKYYPMIGEMDVGVGRILESVDNLGIRENTVIIFTSDNGAHHEAGTGEPYRGFKGELYEGGHRVPFAVRWPAVIAPGSVSDAPAMTMDLLPTFAAINGIPVPDDLLIDGVSLLPVWKGNGELPERALFWNNGRSQAVRKGEWKLVRIMERKTRETRTELFNLNDDPSETRDLSAEHPEKKATMESALQEWMREMDRTGVKQPAYPQDAAGVGDAGLRRSSSNGTPQGMHLPKLL